VVTICTASLTFSNPTFCPHSVCMCFVWMWEQTAIISLYNINWLVFITKTESVYCAVRTECLNINQVINRPYNKHNCSHAQGLFCRITEMVHDWRYLKLVRIFNLNQNKTKTKQNNTKTNQNKQKKIKQGTVRYSRLDVRCLQIRCSGFRLFVVDRLLSFFYFRGVPTNVKRTASLAALLPLRRSPSAQ
jgi:hypothetical protein